MEIFNAKCGLYVSYNEAKNGRFSDAVKISKELGCVTWLDMSSINRNRLHCPTKIFIRLTGKKEIYFRGVLLAFVSAKELEPDFVLGEANHRPLAWKKKDRKPYPRPNDEYKTVFFINFLEKLQERPEELGTRPPPQRPSYIPLRTDCDHRNVSDLR